MDLSASDLQFAYPQGENLAFPDFQASAGQPLLILGPSGSGKTTLMHLMAGFYASHKGSLHFLDAAMHQLGETERDRFRARNLGVVFQDNRFIASLCMQEQLALQLSAAGKPIREKEIRSLCSNLGVEEGLQRFPHQLSRGQLQRFMIARALVHRPAAILADEPTASLDDRNTEILLELMEETTRKWNTWFILVTHDRRVRNRFNQSISL